MIKLLAIDIDNTLTNEPSSVPSANYHAIRRAIERGVYVTLATGRGHLGATPIIRALHLEGLVICYGGAIIVDAQSGAPLMTTEVKNALLQESLALADEIGVHAQIYQGDCIVCAADDVYTRRYTERLGLPVRIEPRIREMEWHHVPKVLWIAEPAKAEALIPQMQAHFEGRLKVSGSSPGFVEFNMLGVDKGTGLARLAAHLGFAREEVAAIGDNTLDAEMIEWAGLGAAVGDAKEEIKALADVVTPACGDCGVAWLIDKLLEER